MTKVILIFFFVTFAGESYGTPQRPYDYRVDFYNVCGYPVQISAFHHSNIESLDASDSWSLKPEELATRVLDNLDFTNRVHLTIPENYRLEISADGKTISLDKTQFLEVLERTPREGDLLYPEWTIKDPSLCPLPVKVEQKTEPRSPSGQRLYTFRVDLYNICYYPIKVTVFNNSNIESPNSSESWSLKGDEYATRVLNNVDSTDKVQLTVPEDYKLEISANGKTVTLDKAQFLEVLEKTPNHARFWDYIYSNGDPFRRWTIKNPDWCWSLSPETANP
jgi:hypothetical protein